MMPRLAPLGILVSVFGLLACVACSTTGVGGPDPTIESNTNWLTACAENEDCPGSSLCECGVCTVACEVAGDCTDQAEGAVCADPASESLSALCGSDLTESSGLCLPACDTDDDCGTGSSCVDGACAGAQDGATGTACESAAHCIGGLSCEEGVCATNLNCEPESSICGGALGADPTALFVCEDGTYQPRLDCAFACVQLDETRGACVPEPCPVQGFFCGVELGVVPQDALFECTGSGIEFVSECAVCDPGAGESTCGE